jgi:hypothetical protein
VFPYQLSKVMADQHIRDMVVAAERHNRIATARRHQRNLTSRPSRLKVVTTQITRTMSQLYGPRSAGTRSTATSISDAGPMGCSA